MISASEIQETLKDLILQFGPPNDSNSRMYSSVLKSALANSPREAGLIDLSLDLKIPARISAYKGNPQIIPQLIQELSSSQRVDNQSAEWIVKTWAKAMGMNVSIQQPVQQQFQQPSYTPPQPQVNATQYQNQYQGNATNLRNSGGFNNNYQSPPTPQKQSLPSPSVHNNNQYTLPQTAPDKIICPQCGTPMPRSIGERCIKCGYATRYAGFLIRLLAYFIDSLILGIISVIIFVVVVMITLAAIAGTQSVSAGLIGIIMFFVIVLVIGVIYNPYFESSEYQATPGKMILKIKVIDKNYTRISLGTAVVRYLGKILSGLLFCIGYLMIIFNENKQGLHDTIAETYVIHT